MSGVFDDFKAEAYPFKFEGQITVGCIAGGTPTDPKVAEGWLRTKLGADKEDDIRAMAAKVMVDRGVTLEEATEVVNAQKHLNGFKKDKDGLFIEGRQLKAAIKEAASIAVAAGKLDARGWGKTNKGLQSYVAEHIFVVEDKLYLGSGTPGKPVEFVHNEPTGVSQRFVHTFRGSGIQNEEYVEDAIIDFTVITDEDFTKKQWAMLWTAGEQNGIGASRSQGYGRYEVTRWEKVK